MAKTASDLAKHIGRELLLIDGVSELAGEDDATIKEISEAFHETLPSYDVNVTWNYDSIPEKVFIPLARLLAAVCASTFGEALPQSEFELRMEALKTAAKFPYLGTRLSTDFPTRSRGLFNFTTGQ
jgi:hypothetical protein